MMCHLSRKIPEARMCKDMVEEKGLREEEN